MNKVRPCPSEGQQHVGVPRGVQSVARLGQHGERRRRRMRVPARVRAALQGPHVENKRWKV